MNASSCARAINRETVIVPSGETIRAVERLPISLLRLPEKIVGDLRMKIQRAVWLRSQFRSTLLKSWVRES